MIARQGNKKGEKELQENTERTTERRNKQRSKEKRKGSKEQENRNISQILANRAPSWAQNGAFHTSYTLYTGSSPPALFISLFQLRCHRAVYEPDLL